MKMTERIKIGQRRKKDSNDDHMIALIMSKNEQLITGTQKHLKSERDSLFIFNLSLAFKRSLIMRLLGHIFGFLFSIFRCWFLCVPDPNKTLLKKSDVLEKMRVSMFF